MYPYGLNNGDSEFRFGDSYYYYYGHCLELKVDRFGFPFFSKRHYKLHVRMIPWYVNCTKEVLKIPYLLFENSSSSGPLWYLLFCLVFSNCVLSILSDRHPISYWKSCFFFFFFFFIFMWLVNNIYIYNLGNPQVFRLLLLAFSRKLDKQSNFVYHNFQFKVHLSNLLCRYAAMEKYN